MKTANQTANELLMLKQLVKKNLGFNSEHYKETHFKRRIDVRLRSTNSGGYGDYINVLNNDPSEYTALMEVLTVNVTNFFRNPEAFDVIEKKVLPSIIEAKKNTPLKSIRIWSAGCSIGVEAYSIAIQMHRILKKDFGNYKIIIEGTDIDKASLLKAEQGMYTKSEIADVDSKTRDQYFELKDGMYCVIDDIKKVTSFKRHDLISGPKRQGFDIIFCRNVTIYFEKDLQEQLYLNFYNALNKYSFFVMGKTETLVGPSKDLFDPFNAIERIYAKNEGMSN